MLPLRVVVIVVATCAVYANSLNGPMVLDDRITITENPQIRELWRPSVLTPERELPVAGRPLANVTFAVNYARAGTDVRWYHATNLLVHILCALAVVALLRRLMALPAVGAHVGAAGADVAWAVTLLWALHPLNSEIIDYLTQRTEALMALFYVLTLYASLRALDPPRRARWTAIAVAACVAGVGCKEAIATAPLMVMLIDRFFVFDSWKAAWRARRGLYLGLMATWVLLGAILVTSPRGRSVGFDLGVTVWTYLLNQTVMITRYVWLTVWPRDLVVYYGWPRALTTSAVLPEAGFVVGLLALTAAGLRFRPKAAFFGVWFFLTLAPTSSVVPIVTEVGAERRMYLPLLALLTLAVITIWKAVRAPTLRYTIVATLAVLLGALTVARNAEYADPLELAELTLARWPSGMAHQMVAEQLLAAGRRDEGIAHLREAAKDNPRAHYSLGVELLSQERLDEGIAELHAFVRLQPLLLEVPAAQVMLGRAYARQGRWDEGIVQVRQAIAKAPGNSDARLALADILLEQEKSDEAIAAYQDYLRMRPADVDALTHLGVLLTSSGRTDAALPLFRRAVEIDPANPGTHRNLATALVDAKRFEEAAEEARRAIALLPTDPVSYDRLGQALAYQGQLEEALVQFARASQIDPGYEEARQHADQVRTLLGR
jgi:tetratricopeptide (TPR) repeat protein